MELSLKDKEYTKKVEKYLEVVEYFSVESVEPQFDLHNCELCDSLPGDRFLAHGYINDDFYIFSICSDCSQYVSNSELPLN